VGDVKQRAREALLEAAPKLRPFVLQEPYSGFEFHETSDVVDFAGSAVAGLINALMLVAREIDLLRDEITSHQPPA